MPLTIICRLSLEQGKVPRAWKQAHVVPVFKKGQKGLPENYRSVSLLPLFGKVLERVVYFSMFNHVKPVLSIYQHGFMPKRSCVTNLATMLHDAWDNVSTGLQTDVIYTDYSAAFQSVNHALLLHKLRLSYKISGRALAWLEFILHGQGAARGGQWYMLLLDPCTVGNAGGQLNLTFVVRVLYQRFARRSELQLSNVCRRCKIVSPDRASGRLCFFAKADRCSVQLVETVAHVSLPQQVQSAIVLAPPRSSDWCVYSRRRVAGKSRCDARLGYRS